MDRLSAKNGHFTDSRGNIILLRGVNLSGSSKVPFFPDGNTAYDQGASFSSPESVSFVGRPFPIEEAEEHLERLKRWGFNFIRFIITWEAVEHGGPGIYDEDYIEYIGQIVSIAEKKGIYLFIDPHQDVWSRFTGGDGAPAWTLETVGIDVRKLPSTSTVILHHVRKENYRRMSWPLNYQKYPAASMFTVFFGGNFFAQGLKVDSMPIQDWLQERYISACLRIAVRIAKNKNVVGFDSLNEPSPGWIGRKSLSSFEGIGAGVAETPSPFQEMCLSEGVPISVFNSFLFGTVRVPFGIKKLGEKNISIWKKDSHCIWRKHGVWDYDPHGAPILLKDDYFSHAYGKEVDFFKDCLKPFARKFQTALQKVEKKFFIFLESDPAKLELDWHYESKKGYGGVVNATHWYDVTLLFTKRYLEWFGVHSFFAKPLFGRKSIMDMYFSTMDLIKKMSKEKMGNCPTVIGETGIPMDMEYQTAYKKNEYSLLEKAMDRIFQALEKNFLNVTLWNYTPDNTHEHGDKWNGEDLSIFSRDTDPAHDPEGGRTRRAFSRPYPTSTAGEPLSLSFDMEKSLFKYTFKSPPNAPGACSIFIPEIHYANEFRVTVNAGTWKFDKKSRILKFKGEEGVNLNGITVSP